MGCVCWGIDVVWVCWLCNDWWNSFGLWFFCLCSFFFVVFVFTCFVMGVLVALVFFYDLLFFFLCLIFFLFDYRSFWGVLVLILFVGFCFVFGVFILFCCNFVLVFWIFYFLLFGLYLGFGVFLVRLLFCLVRFLCSGVGVFFMVLWMLW